MPANVITESEVTLLSTSSNSSSSSSCTPQQQQQQRIHYVHCTSKCAYSVGDDKSAEEVNETLNLNLGLKYVDPWNPRLRKTLRTVVDLFSWLETLCIALWVRIPLRLRHEVCMRQLVLCSI